MTIKTISILMVVIGSLSLPFSYPDLKEICGNVLVSDGLRKRWLVIISLIGIFLFGYVFFDFALIFNLPIPLELVTGSVFFGGAVFVYLIINTSRSTIMAQKKAEEALRDRELCFHAIFDSINDAIIVQDQDSEEILGVNNKMCMMFGYTHDEARQLLIDAVIANIEPQDVKAWTDKSTSIGARSFECVAKNSGGLHFWVELTIQNALIDGQYRRLLTMRDINKRKQSEERLSKLNECFLGFVANHEVNITRLTTLCGEMMGAACALYNKLDSGILNTQAHWNVPPDFKISDNAAGSLCADLIEQGGDQLFCVRNLAETKYAESDPNIRRYNLLSYVGMPVKCNDTIVGCLCVLFQKDFSPDEEVGKFMGILASAIGVEEERRIAAEHLRTAHAELENRVRERTSELGRANEQLLIDIAERKKTEDALWRSETIMHRVFEAIPDMLTVIDRDLRIVHSNWQGGYEYVPVDIRAGSPSCYDAYYPEQGKPCEDCHALKVFLSGRPLTTEKYNPRVGLVEVRAFPIFDDSSEVVMVAEYIRNITEQKRLEEELRKAHKLESLGVLAGGIAHDFNNLLTGVLGNMSLAKIMMESDSKAFKRLDEAEKAIFRARDLTQQLMTFSKGGSPVKKAASIEQIVKDSASFVLRGSNVRCEYMIPKHVWPVEVDEGQMNQVINNLIINADQSMVKGGIIKVGIENLNIMPQNEMSLADGRYVKITIMDHGIGIPKEHLHKIFDPYFTTKQKGNGLGLATVYSIIKNHDGYIGVESIVGFGTTFQIFIPASENGLEEVSEIKENPQVGSGRILVMDDEEIIREVAAEILGHLGYSAVVCGDGSEAIELYLQAIKTKEPFGAVIMDLTIPGGMGGKETMEKLMEIDNGVIGIVSSGYCSDPILSNYRYYGFSGMVGKPYSLDELGNVLQNLLAHGSLLKQ